MSAKFKEFIARQFGFGDKERPTGRSGIDVSYNGTSTVSSDELERALFKRFEEMDAARKRVAAQADSD